jgi:DsbC/DsbD-like thiol-disulfide interchange protein
MSVVKTGMLAPLAFLLTSRSRLEPVTGTVELVSELRNVRAWQPFKVGIRLIPTAGWHTYWMNPGDSGSPTSVQWRLPKGWTASQLQWPAPSRILTGGIVSYGYNAPTILLATLTPSAAVPSGPIQLAGRVDWLTCTSQVCKPAKGEFHLKLATTAGVPEQDPVWHVRLAEEEALVPTQLAGATAEARREGDHVVLSLSGPSAVLEKQGQPYFFPDATGMISHSKPQSFWPGDNALTGHLPISEYSVKPPARLVGVLKAPPRDSFAGGVTAVFIDVPITGAQEKNHA